MLEAALKAQARGFHIFPVAAGLKVPHRFAGKWGETATNDISQIIRFWTQADPNANVGIACKPSQLLVIDLDRAKEDFKLRGTDWAYLHDGYGPRVDGVEVFDEMVFKLGAGQHPVTYSVLTGSGGHHLYYRWPSHWPAISQASPVKGIVDVRGNGGQYGGYVLAEGSRTESGVYVCEDPAEPGLPPEWIRHLVAERPRQPSVRRPGGVLQPSAVSWSGLVEKVRQAGEGNRNNITSWAARTMCEEGATIEDALNTLGPAAQESGLGWAEVERTILSSYRIQRSKMG